QRRAEVLEGTSHPANVGFTGVAGEQKILGTNTQPFVGGERWACHNQQSDENEETFHGLKIHEVAAYVNFDNRFFIALQTEHGQSLLSRRKRPYIDNNEVGIFAGSEITNVIGYAQRPRAGECRKV